MPVLWGKSSRTHAVCAGDGRVCEMADPEGRVVGRGLWYSFGVEAGAGPLR